MVVITYLHLARRMSMSRAVPLHPHHYARHGLLSDDFYIYLFQGLFQRLYRESHICSVLNCITIPYSHNRHQLFSVLFMVCEFRKFHGALFVLFRTSWRLCCIAGLANFWSNVTPPVFMKPEPLKLKTISTFETSVKHSSKHTVSQLRRPKSY